VLIDGFSQAALSMRNAQQGYDVEAPSVAHLGNVYPDLSRYVAASGDSSPNEDDAAARITAAWERSTRLFHALCRSQGIALVHLLQPNQYFGSRGAASAENGLAIDRDSEFRHGVEVVFPRLRERAATLSRNGVPVLDATGIFDRVPDAVYSDDCCHYNLRGNLVIKDLVVDVLRGSLGAGATGRWLARATRRAPRPRSRRAAAAP
jgi:hypothetical protein